MNRIANVTAILSLSFFVEFDLSIRASKILKVYQFVGLFGFRIIGCQHLC